MSHFTYSERKQIAEFGRSWLSQILAIYNEKDQEDEYVEQSAQSVDHEVDDEINEVADYIEAASYDPHYAGTVDTEVDGEMDEVLDYIEASSYSPRRAVPVDFEVDDEMNEVLDYIEASSYTPRRAQNLDDEIDGEMDEVLQEIDKEGSWANPFRNVERPKTRRGQKLYL